MKLSTNPPIHLSNYEVLTHFVSVKKETDELAERIAAAELRAKVVAATQIPPNKSDKDFEQLPSFEELPILSAEEAKKEREANRRGLSQELVWIQNQVIKYLCSEDMLMTARQSEEGVTRLADELQDHNLSKAEVLTISNLVPLVPAEIYCMIEEVDLRFRPDPASQLDAIINLVDSTLLPAPPPELETYIVKRRKHNPNEQRDHPGVVLDMQGDVMMEGGIEDEFVHEAEWGRDKEDGVGEEREGDMD
ncbi:hypothetical protein BCR39DRAFT_280782 [Naematelia encephala]|uniref:DNA-directed RNA polymerase III subunit RPC9 n=1 Tax=Naematelia encephala TaxID=71784 RepID=A0A1Y2AT80_9TREE|nr:hypothetical protein BCR39DRAFT_280782 [Naematelia encephala]